MSARKAKQDRKEARKQRSDALAVAALAAELGEEALSDNDTRNMTEIELAAYERWAAKERRARYPRMMPVAKGEGEVEVLYAKYQKDLQALNDGAKVKLLMDTDAWQGTLGVRCDELDLLMDVRRAYTHAEIEAAVLYQQLNGKRSYKAALEDLNGFQGQFARRDLGFDHPRDHVPNRRCDYEHHRNLDGTPSRATVSRHLRWRFPEHERAVLYAECFRRLVIEHAIRFPDFREELLTLGWDGTIIRSLYTPGFKRYRNGDLIRDEDGKKTPRLNEWEGGSRTAADVPESKRGHGFLAVTGHTSDALPVAVRLAKLHEGEKQFVVEMLGDEIAELRPYLDPERIGVSTLDSLFAAPDIRRAHRAVGYLENTHRVSGSDSEVTTRHLEKLRHDVFEIEGYPNWRANGLRQLFCICGNGDSFARPGLTAKGEATSAVEGACPTCGPIHVTSGDWRREQNPDRFVMVNPNDNVDENRIDWMFGHFLHRDDKRSHAYGLNRYSQGEGMHGHASTRFELFADGAPYKRIDPVALQVTMTYCLMHGMAMECRRRKGQTELDPAAPSGSPPPALALAA
ncbi:MAG: hypothetical protein ABSG64_04530 [Solirubrobacteraceae bacterium]|jgi:hypothetical protein